MKDLLIESEVHKRVIHFTADRTILMQRCGAGLQPPLLDHKLYKAGIEHTVVQSHWRPTRGRNSIGEKNRKLQPGTQERKKAKVWSCNRLFKFFFTYSEVSFIFTTRSFCRELGRAVNRRSVCKPSHILQLSISN